MRLGFIYPSNAYNNSQYRALMPLNVMRQRGHDIAWSGPSSVKPPIDILRSCDLVHVYRAADPRVLNALKTLRATGVAVTWDNDDDITALAQRSTNHQLAGMEWQRDLAAQIRAIRLASSVTTTSNALAERFRGAGASHVQVIENYLPPEFVLGKRPSHPDLVVGWVAAMEHEADAQLLGLHSELLKLLETHTHVRVITVGLDLRLAHRRYERRAPVLFNDLAGVIREFDVGIAPLVDDAFNRARSNVKVKEYAVAGLPWLASPVGEYALLGRWQGGLLVADGEWYTSLDRLIRSRRKRFTLGTHAKLWARGQTIDLNIARWEVAFEDAISRARASI